VFLSHTSVLYFFKFILYPIFSKNQVKISKSSVLKSGPLKRGNKKISAAKAAEGLLQKFFSKFIINPVPNRIKNPVLNV